MFCLSCAQDYPHIPRIDHHGIEDLIWHKIGRSDFSYEMEGPGTFALIVGHDTHALKVLKIRREDGLSQEDYRLRNV